MNNAPFHATLNFRIECDENPYDNEIDYWIESASGDKICSCLSKQDAEFIVLSCNSFYKNEEINRDILAALKMVNDRLSERESVDWDMIDEAITKAQGGAQ